MQIKSDGQGVVTKIGLSEGGSADAGAIIIETELMKMTTQYRVPVDANIIKIHTSIGEHIDVGRVLFEYEQVAEQSEAETVRKSDPSPLNEELEKRRHAISDEGRVSRVQKRHQSSGRTARENLADLVDEGSFTEMGTHVLAAQHSTHTREQLIDRSAADGVLVGTAEIFGIPVAVLIVDYTVMAGTQGYFHHKKIDRLLEVCAKRKLPLILYPEGGGGRPNDVDAHHISVAQLELMTFHRLAALRQVAPVIAVVHGYCFAGSAAFAAVADVIITTKQARIGMGGPAMIEGGGLGTFHPDEIGPAEMHAKTGAVHVVCGDEAEATGLAKRLFALLNNSEEEPVAPSPFDLDNFIPMDRRTVFDMRTILATVFDADGFTELKSEYGRSLITGLARLEGRSVGVLASNCMELGGAIGGDAADKATELFALCQKNGLPVISFIDTPGFMVGPEAETTGQIRPIGNLFVEGGRFKPPLLCVVVRRAYGLGAMAMAGGGLHASDLTLSWPSGEFGAMGLEGAVRLGMKEKLSSFESEEKRQKAIDTMVDELQERGKAMNAATFFEVDDVIMPNETRSKLITGLAALR